jgi:uncharacterized protein (TIGR02646 family)
VRKINKQEKCDVLEVWNKRNPESQYKEIDDDTRRSLREFLLREQYGLCAFCCQSIADIEHCHNEHLRAQASNNTETLNYENIVASCNTKRQCGDAHGSKPLPLTPVMPECETELRFKLSGRVEGLTKRAKEAVQVLNLGDSEENNRALVEKRKQLVDALLWKSYGAPADELQLEKNDMIEIVIDEISKPQNGLLDPFAPVLINVLRQQLKG